MTHYEVYFRLRHDCPLNNLSQKYPAAMITFWCNFDRDVLEVNYSRRSITPEFRRDFATMLKEIGGRPHRQTSTDTSLQVVTRCDNLKLSYATSRVFARHNCLSVQPSFHTKGWEWYRVIAFSAKDVKALFSDLDKSCEVEVLSKGRISGGAMKNELIPSSNLLGRLSNKQLQVLEYALRSGYYMMPKKTTSRELARRLTVPRTTFQEHLRKAEIKIMQSVAPLVQVSSRAKEPSANGALKDDSTS